MAGRRAMTTDQTIQSAKARTSAGIDSHRLRRAIRRPLLAQKLASSGRQSSITRGISVWPGTWISASSAKAGNWSSTFPCACRSMERIVMCIQPNETSTTPKSSAKHEV